MEKIKRRANASDIRRMIALRERGMTYRDIGDELGFSGNAVSWHCMKWGVESPRSKWKSYDKIPGPLIQKRGNHIVRRFTPEEDAILMAMRLEGKRIVDICRRLGRKTNSIIGRILAIERRNKRNANA